jgi:hypothetical protein
MTTQVSVADLKAMIVRRLNLKAVTPESFAGANAEAVPRSSPVTRHSSLRSFDRSALRFAPLTANRIVQSGGRYGAAARISSKQCASPRFPA